jgi:hypothetical protein
LGRLRHLWGSVAAVVRAARRTVRVRDGERSADPRPGEKRMCRSGSFLDAAGEEERS